MNETEKLVEAEFEVWWGRTGRYIDPDTEDVPWFDKRKQLAEEAFHAAKAALLAHVNGLRELVFAHRTQQVSAENQVVVLRAENERLKASFTVEDVIDGTIHRRIQKLEQKNAALRAYAMHTDECALYTYRRHASGSAQLECTCGLKAALES